MTANFRTKQYYTKNADVYISNTLTADMSQQYTIFERYLPKNATILDVGFGSGRDMLHFKKAGYSVHGIDNVVSFVETAKQKGLSVEVMDFNSITLKTKFDAIWACASLLHSTDLCKTMENLLNVLKDNGIIFISMKYGLGSEEIDGRFFQYIDEETLKELCTIFNLSIKELWLSSDRLNRQTTWINCVVSKWQ